MNNSPKLINSFSYRVSKAQPLTLKEVIQLRDGMEITRKPNPVLLQTVDVLPISLKIIPLNSLN
jgi:hypothetical protein